MLALVALGAGCGVERTVETSLRIERLQDDSEAPVYDVFVVIDGVPGTRPEGYRVGQGQGCGVSEFSEFHFKQQSIAEVYCFFSGGGDLFQVRENDTRDLEVVRFDLDELIEASKISYIEASNPESVYTIDLEDNWTIVRKE